MGVGMIAVLFGVWQGFLALSLVFLMQALMFGDGGVTALPVNALALGLGGSPAAVAVHRCCALSQRPPCSAAGWFGTVVPAMLVALVLGCPAAPGQAADGRPCSFPSPGR